MVRRLLCLVLLSVAALPAGAGAGVPPPGRALDLSAAEVRITGPAGQRIGESVAAAGDVNGDGLGDLVVGAPGATSTAGDVTRTGRAYVVFGGPGRGGVDALRLGAGGETITGPGDGAIGTFVGGVGDVNGDGLDDVAVGSPTSAGNAGAAWVVFGSRRARNVVVDALGRRGFAIAGRDTGGLAGASVTGAGDVDRDGLADLLVAAPAARRVWVVRGAQRSSAVVLAPGTRTRLVRDLPPSGSLSLAGLGDVDRRGRPDFAVGAPGADGGRGAAFVVFGEALGADVVPTLAGFSGGLAIGSAGAGSFTGASVGGWGDSGGDGLRDVLVGAPHAIGAAAPSADGAAYLVAGRRSAARVDLSAPGAARRLGATGSRDALGASVAGLGDVNDDRLADVAAGAPGADPSRRRNAGRVLLAFGARTSAALDGRAPGGAGFGLTGTARRSRAGAAVSGIGDFDGDGAADLAVGLPGGGREGAGEVAVVLGSRGLREAGGAAGPGAYVAPPVGQENRAPDSAIAAPRAARQRARRLRRFRGEAFDDRGIRRVELSLVRSRRTRGRLACTMLRRDGRLHAVGARAGRCAPRGWLRTSGAEAWSLRLRRPLPAGSYTLWSRAIDAQGLKEKAFSSGDGNVVRFTAR